MTTEPKVLRIACTGSMTVALADLVRFQGGLKELPEENYLEFRGQMLRLGFSSPFHLWRGADGAWRVIDGHQRLTVLTRMAADGVSMPDAYPAVEVYAENEQEARQKVLALASTYGVVREDGLRQFALDAGLTALDLRRDFRLPDIDLKTLTLDPPPAVEPEAPAAPAPDDDPPEPVSVPKRVLKGDLWRLGRHLLLCGDSGDAAAVARLGAGGAAHALVSDPPYGLAFMGKAWDKAVPQTPLWKVWVDQLAPGAHLLVFSGTRTYHRATVALEDAGVEIRDQMQWLYGSGFPKSHNVSKELDRRAGAEREVLSSYEVGDKRGGKFGAADAIGGQRPKMTYEVTAPSTDEAKEWEGFGTALKPANEPIAVARKPCEGTVAECVQKHGTGALNIADTRIGTTCNVTPSGMDRYNAKLAEQGYRPGSYQKGSPPPPDVAGRWPANVVFSHTSECVQAGTKTVGSGGRKTLERQRGGFMISGSVDNVQAANSPDTYGTETVDAWECSPECPVRMLDEQSGETKSVPRVYREGEGHTTQPGGWKTSGRTEHTTGATDSGGASRFFYCAKPARSERGAGNKHATVKPLRLMEYLVRLVTADEQTVLEPFCGSGTTLLACERTGRRCLGSELDPDHCDIILARFEALTGVAPELVERLDTETPP